MDIREGKRDKEQKIALLKLIWGIAVMITGTFGLFGAFKGIAALLFIGAGMDIIDSILMFKSGGVITAIFFSIAGVLICFFCFSSPWWFGLCTGLCCEACLGGIFGYSLRLANFLTDIKGSASKNLKKTIRNILKKL